MTRSYPSTLLAVLSLLIGGAGCSDESTSSGAPTEVGADAVTNGDASPVDAEGELTAPSDDGTPETTEEVTAAEDTGAEDAELSDTGAEDTSTEDAELSDTPDSTDPEDVTGQDTEQEDVEAPCVPNCDGKNCGADGCGNLCGICLGETECVTGLCTSTEDAPDALIDQAVPVSAGSPYVSGELYAMTVDTSYRVVVFWRGDNQDGTDDLLLSSSDPLVTEFTPPYVLKAGVESLPITSGGDMDTAGSDLIFTWRDEVNPCNGLLCGQACSNCYPGQENCFDVGIGKACDVYGSCVASEDLQCSGPIATDCETHPCGVYCDPCLDVLEDGDGDGIPDVQDLFPADPTESGDGDQDGIGDNADDDDDNDGTTDDIDADDDNDGTTDEDDALPSNPNETVDTDGDGMGDNSDPEPGDPYGPCDDSLPHSCAPDGQCEITGTFLCKEPLAGDKLVMFRRATLPALEGEDLVIFETSGGTELWRPHIVKRDDQAFCVVWQQNKTVQIRCTEDGGTTFGPQQKVSSESSTATVSDGAFTEAGSLVIAYQESVGLDVGRIQTVISEDLGQTWSWPIEASLGAPAGKHVKPSMARGDTDKMHVVWHRQSGGQSSAWISSSVDGVEWSTPAEIPTLQQEVGIKPGRQYNLHVSGVEGVLGMAPTSYMTSYDEGENWGEATPIPVTDGAMLLAHEIEANQVEGWLHIAWWETVGGSMVVQQLMLVTVEP